jgi:hypothetical protein
MSSRLFSSSLAAAVLAISAHAQTAPNFEFLHEFYGSLGYTDPEAMRHLQNGSANGLTFTPPVVNGIAQLVAPFKASLMLRLPGASSPAGISDSEIEKQRLSFDALAAQNANLDFTWDLLPEWDQAGGSWVPDGRPKYSGLSKAAAHAKFLNYYRQRFPQLMTNLASPASARKYHLAAVTDYAMNAFDAYDLGVDLCMTERGIDELADLSTGIAFLRGAAHQYGRPWGVDLSSWRTSNNAATQYDSRNVLIGGWSESYLARHYYAAFLAGANVLQNEAATYTNSKGDLNPFGQATQDFADFALRRHPDVGGATVTTAFLISSDAGFDPKHGAYNQANAVWYQDIAYNNGDFMIDNLLRTAFPNHWQHGLTPGAPFANAAGVPDTAKFQAFLAAGGDPRPYEPMPTTRWGDNIDIVTSAIGAPALAQYKVLVLLGDVSLDDRLRSDLRDWVNNGGTLVMNAEQMTASDVPMFGVNLANASPRTASSATSAATGVKQTESAYSYRMVQPATADVLMTNENGDPLITRQADGAGQAILMTASFLQPKTKDRLLNHAVQFLDAVISGNSAAQVVGAPVEYVVNALAGKTIVSVINHSSTSWTGTISANIAATSVTEYTQDVAVPFQASAISTVIRPEIPPYGVRVFAFEFATPASAKAQKPRPRSNPSK